MNKEFSNAYKFLFNETYAMWKNDLEKIFKIGTHNKTGGCNLSTCILVLIGIESFSLFFSKGNQKKAFVAFINKFYLDFYKNNMDQVYLLFRHGLAHNFYPKSKIQTGGHVSQIIFRVNQDGKVASLSKIKKELDCFRHNQNLTPKKHNPYVIAPQVLFLDTIDVMEKLNKEIGTNKLMQKEFVENYEKVKKILGHKI